MKSAGVGGGMGNGQWTMANVQNTETLRRDRHLGWHPSGMMWEVGRDGADAGGLTAGRSIDGPTQFQCYIAYQFTFDNSWFQFGSKPAVDYSKLL
jgi:hypothetical protein